MNIENAKLRLSDSEKELSYSQRLAIHDLLEQLEADKLEMAKAIVEMIEIQERTYGSGMNLHLDMITYVYDNRRLFEKAQKYIEEVERSERD